jgi:hypothetical protein
MPHAPRHSALRYDPLAAVQADSGFTLFATVSAAPHSTAGPLAALAALVICTTWPTPLNVALLASLLWSVWVWGHAGSPHSELQQTVRPPLARGHMLALLGWVPLQMALEYLLQIQQLSCLATWPSVAWLNIGVATTLPSVAARVLFGLHATALALLYLALAALRCTYDRSLRAWPSDDLVLTSIEQTVRAAGASVAAPTPGDRHDYVASSGSAVSEGGAVSIRWLHADSEHMSEAGVVTISSTASLT